MEESKEIQLYDINLSNFNYNDIFSFTIKDSTNTEMTELFDWSRFRFYSFLWIWWENVEAYEEGSFASSFNPVDCNITQIYDSLLESHLNISKLSIYDAGYNGRELIL